MAHSVYVSRDVCGESVTLGQSALRPRDRVSSGSGGSAIYTRMMSISRRSQCTMKTGGDQEPVG